MTLIKDVHIIVRTPDRQSRKYHLIKLKLNVIDLGGAYIKSFTSADVHNSEG